MKLPRSRPHSSSCPSHAQSMTSDLRPGTFFTCRAFDQHDLQGIALAQGVEDRLPVHPGRLHRHVRDALLDQPPNHLLQHGVEGLELSDLLTSLPRALPRHPNSDRDLPLAHIDPRDPCVHDLHNGLLPAATDQPGHVTRGSRIKIKILRFALTGSNPGYPTGAGSSVNLRA